jgi:hypothetical protein
MADKKISALTGATTPLAGTEVLPIVQSSTTVKVSVANLTAGRDVSATSIAAGLGAIGTPAYTFTGDLNTGVWSPAADTLAVSAGGVEAMRVTSATNVGFGTTSPSGKVESSVTSSGAIVNALTISNPVPNAVNTGVALFFNPNGAASAARSASIKSVQSSSGNFADLRFFTAPGDEPIQRLCITATGDVGIGTTTPATGSMSNAAVVSAGVFSTSSGSVASTSGVAATIAVANQNYANATYIVSCAISSGAPTVYSAVAIVSADNNVLRSTTLQIATNMAISVSGTNIQATQTSGGAATILYTLTRVS